ncbi:hypothetical protein JCM8097_007017 [Rhodosporidiobolus ruineniae]
MPSTASIAVKALVGGKYSFKATWDVDLAITAKRFELNQRIEVDGGPAGEAWGLSAEKEDGELTIDFAYEGDDDIEVESRSRTAAGTLSLYWVDSRNTPHRLSKRTFDSVRPDIECDNESDSGSAPSLAYWGDWLALSKHDWNKTAGRYNGAYKPSSHRAYCIVLELECTFESPSEPSVVEVHAEGIARRLSDLHLERVPHDVRLVFPCASDVEAELWAKGAFLSKSSPYLKDLLASEFAESVSRTSKRKRSTSSAPNVAHSPDEDEQDFVDSDTETDRFLFSKHSPQIERSAEVDLPFRQITITRTAYSTYRALLVCLSTNHIAFTPLTSSFDDTSGLSSTKLRRRWLAEYHQSHPDLPLPVSPKSAYRLAHLLQLPDLQKRSLDAFRSFLTASNAAHELFSDTSVTYDELRGVVVGFVQEHWGEVKASEGWKAMRVHIQSGEAPATFLPVLMEVLEKVA